MFFRYALQRWLMDLDILPIHGRPLHPQTQGKIERFHRTMKNELLKRNAFIDLADADKHLKAWRTKYNEVRPHEAIDMRCPADIYMHSITERDAFSYGFRLGVQLMAESFLLPLGEDEK